MPDDRPVCVGTTYRLLVGPGPLKDLLRCRVTKLQPPHLVEWFCQGTTRTLRLAVVCTEAPEGTVRVHTHWWWIWKGWRRVPGVARAAHNAAYAVAATATGLLKASLEKLKRGQQVVCSAPVPVTEDFAAVGV